MCHLSSPTAKSKSEAKPAVLVVLSCDGPAGVTLNQFYGKRGDLHSSWEWLTKSCTDWQEKLVFSLRVWQSSPMAAHVPQTKGRLRFVGFASTAARLARPRKSMVRVSDTYRAHGRR